MFRFILGTILLVIAVLPAESVELRVGKGDFDINAEIAQVFKAHLVLDTKTISLSQSPVKIPDFPVYVSFRLDYFDSDAVNQLTDFAAQAVGTDIPLFGLSPEDVASEFTAVPVPADYRLHGINLDLSLGYRWLSKPQGSIDLALNTGLTFPFMKTKNLQNDANLLLDLLDTFSTEIRSYKIGPAVYGHWQPNRWLSLNLGLVVGYQTGQLENTLLDSGVNIEGRYFSGDLSVRLALEKILSHQIWAQGFYLSAGYQRSEWRYDKTTIDLAGVNFTAPAVLDMDFSHQSLFVGLGYQFK